MFVPNGMISLFCQAGGIMKVTGVSSNACIESCKNSSIQRLKMKTKRPLCIMEDSHGFILHSQVMQNTTDDKVAVPMVKATQEKFPSFNACSFDKGFHSPANQTDLKAHIEQVILPKKGKLSKADQEREYAPEIKQAKKQHSAVESAINALEVHGLDKCLDHGIDAFERYVGLAVLSRNIQKLGTIKRDMERLRLFDEQQKRAA